MNSQVMLDGESWIEVTPERLNELLADPQQDGFLLLENGAEGFAAMGFASVRSMLNTPPLDWSKRPTELYGIPVVFEDSQ